MCYVLIVFTQGSTFCCYFAIFRFAPSCFLLVPYFLHLAVCVTPGRSSIILAAGNSFFSAGEGGSIGYTLKAAVPDEDATEALGGGLRKHKGTRNAGKSPSGWNNFSKRCGINMFV